MSNHEFRAAKGAKLLDEHVPGWADKVDLETFLITSTGRCILGQVFGGWLEGTTELSILSDIMFGEDDGRIDPRTNQEDYGFELTYYEYVSEDSYIYTGQALEAAWTREIKARQS